MMLGLCSVRIYICRYATSNGESHAQEMVNRMTTSSRQRLYKDDLQDFTPRSHLESWYRVLQTDVNRILAFIQAPTLHAQL